MTSKNQLEEGAALTLDFDKLASVAEVPGVLPCAVQNADTNEVILVAYVNQQALQSVDRHALRRVLEHLPQRALGEGQDLRRDLRPGRSARQLRAELPALPRASPPRRHLPHEERRRPAAQLLLPPPRLRLRRPRQLSTRTSTIASQSAPARGEAIAGQRQGGNSGRRGARWRILVWWRHQGRVSPHLTLSPRRGLGSCGLWFLACPLPLVCHCEPERASARQSIPSAQRAACAGCLPQPRCFPLTLMSPACAPVSCSDGFAGVAGAQPMRGGPGGVPPGLPFYQGEGAEQRESDAQQAWLDTVEALHASSDSRLSPPTIM